MKLHRLTKFDVTEEPRCATAQSQKEYRLDIERLNGWDEINQYEGLSPNVGYTVVGELRNMPEEGGFLWMDRKKRNDVVCLGDFRTSRIQEVFPPDKDGSITFRTYNSFYKMEEVGEEEAKEIMQQYEEYCEAWRRAADEMKKVLE